MSASPTQLLERVLAGESLDEPTAAALLMTMGTGELPPALAGALLVALRAKGETAEEIRGFARGMRELALKPHIAPGPYVDIVGTGGDGSHSLNLSTGSALLAAACGVPVVKHIAPVRQALGVRTVFNILGPLVNPAAPPYHVIGAFSDPIAALMAETLA